ncbi:MAG: nuclear transport factor 2 family protein [Flavobacteriaceae bacterium]|nr:nuclear transport factor 2 family protein [Flavobacteriaceae bacterium]
MKSSIHILLLTIVLTSCIEQNQFDIEKETKEILKLHHLQRDYHFNKDSISFANQLSDNFVSVNRGIISQPKKSETISRYHSYFSSVEFIKWDDVTEPIINFSEDGTLAYTIVDKIVSVKYKNEANETVEGDTHFAWTAIYKKYGDEWKIDCVTSTNKPVEAE